MLTFKTRAEIENKDTARWWIWYSRCGRYRALKSVPHCLKTAQNPGGYCVDFRAEVRVVMRYPIFGEREGWAVISHHEKRHTAEQACKAHDKALIRRSDRVTSGCVVPAVRPAARRRRGGQPAGAD